MDLVRLKRNGKKDLVFFGEEVASITDRGQPNSGCNVWILKLYRTSIHRYILASETHLFTPITMSMYGAVSFACADEVLDYLMEECDGWEEMATEFIDKVAHEDSVFVESLASREPLAA